MSGVSAVSVGQKPLKLSPVEERCESIDYKHPQYRCFKVLGHPLNWHEASDDAKYSNHTWVDPDIKGECGRPVVSIDPL